jgi:hypothetical protein
VETEPSVSQDGFAKRIGIAKGLANAYFNRCLLKGWIKLRHAPRKRYLYYLTPKGFAEKSRLTAQFLTSSYQFYRKARADLLETMADAATHGHLRLAVLGAGELAEIAAVVSDESPVEIIGFVAVGTARKQLVRRPVVQSWSELADAQGALLAILDDAAAAYRAFLAVCPDVPVYVPRQLRPLLGGER